MATEQSNTKWYKNPSTWASIILILILIALIVLLIISMFYVPVSHNQYFDFTNDTRVKIAMSSGDVISESDIRAAAPAIEDIEDVYDIAKRLYTGLEHAVSVRRGNRVVSFGYIDPLDPHEPA